MRVYLDNCCYNRPFDDQNQIRIHLEAQAKLYVQSQIKDSKIELVWSYILDYENAFNPFEERKNIIEKWKSKAILDIEENEHILQYAKELVSLGLKSKDALHVACAIEGKCDYFLTTDDKVLNKLKNYNKIEVVNPINVIANFND
jgi:predicted nucleic acid-binding protein